ncbi:MAG: histidine phosphatase family protein [Actinobacteria bacterium]|nr:histidine phosphatase family protein [Actinomycetota bacterium]
MLSARRATCQAPRENCPDPVDTRRVVLWRHGQTMWNAERRYQGQTDIPLDETGLAQAQRAARQLAALGPHVIVSSDLTRAAETAQALAELTGIPVRYDRRLRERSGGVWEGLTNDEIREGYPVEWARWDPPGGEDDGELAKRMAAAVTDAVGLLPDGGTLVVASHGSAIRAGLGRLLDLAEGRWRMLGPVQNCSWSVIAQAPEGWDYTGWRLVEHNAGTLPLPVLSDDR